MQAQVDLHQWAAYALEGSPALHSGLLNLSPIVDAQPDDVVFEALRRALRSVTDRIVNDSIRDKCDRALDPFQPTWWFWVLGAPAKVFVADKEVHLIDSLSDVAPSSDSILLSVRVRRDTKERRALLDAVAEKFVQAIGLRGILHGAPYWSLVATVLDGICSHQTLRERFIGLLAAAEPGKLRPEYEKLLREFEREGVEDEAIAESQAQFIKKSSVAPDQFITEVRDHVGDEFDKTLLRNILRMLLARHEVAAYNEFAAEAGYEFVSNFLVSTMYPSALWHEVARGHGPMLLGEIGSRLWRFTVLRNRIQRTAAALAEDKTLDELGEAMCVTTISETPFVEARVQANEVFQEDEIARWWFERETLSLRYYLIGMLTFPESFLSILKGEDLARYKDELSKLLDTTAKKEGEHLLTELLPKESPDRINLTELLGRFLQELPGGSAVLLGKPSPPEFFAAHRYLQRELGSARSAALVFLFNDLRNRLVHGLNFRLGNTGTLLFEHKGLGYTASYDTLLLSFHMLPAALLTIYKAYGSHRSR